jgi:hypothetical protein
MSVGVMKDYKLKLRNLCVSHTWLMNFNTILHLRTMMKSVVKGEQSRILTNFTTTYCFHDWNRFRRKITNPE